jgi:membrane protein insertase Oxa1/YidC/SpoIIIJ
MTNVLYTIIIYPLTQIIEFTFAVAQKLFQETGISVLFISSVVSILCLPLYTVAEGWQEKERNIQKKLKQKIEKIKAVFLGDERFMILSTYYRQNHYHPVYALRSTFGLLIQIPFFIAAYSYLSHLEALKGASFFFIPDLGAPDKLFPFLNWQINILPILMTAINCIAGAVYLRGFSIKDKIQLYGMAAVFLLLLYNSPAGLVIYWTMNNVISLIKNLYHKIQSAYKNTVIFTCLSSGCAYMVYYVLTKYRIMDNTKTVIAVCFCVIGIIPWVFPAIKKLIKKHTTTVFLPKETFSFFAVSMLALWVLAGLFLPSMLIASSPQEFSYINSYTTPLYFIQNTALQAFGLFIVWMFCLYFLFPPQTKKIFAVAGFIVFLSALCNALLFPGNYGVISVELTYNENVTHSYSSMIINIAVLLIPLIIVPVLFLLKKQKTLMVTASLCLLSLFSFSLYNIISTEREFKKMGAYYTPVSEAKTEVKPIFNLSRTGKNIVIIMLDRAHSVFMPYIFEESSELNEIYSGFVYYPNTVSFNGFTRMGAPPLFGGYEYTPQEINKRDTVKTVIKHNESLLMLPRIFSENDYEVTVTDPPYPNYSYKEDLRIYDDFPGINAYITDAVYTDLWKREHNMLNSYTSDILKRNLLWYSIMKISPLAFRPGIYFQGDWCSPVSSEKFTLMLNGYAVLDYLPRLTRLEQKNTNTALIMVNNTAHEKSLVQAPDYRPVLSPNNYGTSPFKKEPVYHVNMASIKRLGDWFNFLKAENVYDNTRIIIVSDHGYQVNFITKNKLPFALENFNPLLLVKDFNAHQALQTDMTFMTNADVPIIALQGLVSNPVNPFTGNEITSENKRNPLYIAISGSIHLEDPNETQFSLNSKEDYYVHDNIFDEKNWSKAE